MTELSEIEQRGFDGTMEELAAEGFNPYAWYLKEIPLPNKLMRFCNNADNVEFTTLIRNKGEYVNFAYSKEDKDGSLTDVETNLITTAIELNEE